MVQNRKHNSPLVFYCQFIEPLKRTSFSETAPAILSDERKRSLRKISSYHQYKSVPNVIRIFSPKVCLNVSVPTDTKKLRWRTSTRSSGTAPSGSTWTSSTTRKRPSASSGRPSPWMEPRWQPGNIGIHIFGLPRTSLTREPLLPFNGSIQMQYLFFFYFFFRSKYVNSKAVCVVSV